MRSTLSGGVSSAGATPTMKQFAGVVGRDQLPVTIDRDGRIRLVTFEHELDCFARRLQRRIAQRVLFEHRREARGHEQRIALAQRHVEQLGEMQHHFAARLRAAGFEKAQVLRGDLRFDREVELAHAPPLPPLAQQVADGSGAWRS